MAWTTPKTWSTGATVPASDLNTHVRDNLNALAPDGATSASWTPDVVGATAGTGDAATAGREYRIGPLQFAWAYWDDPGFVPPLVEGVVYVVLPQAAAGITAGTNKGQTIGEWRLFDSSSPLSSITGPCFLASSNQVRFALSDGGVLSHDTIAINTGDSFSFSICYPVD